MTRPVADAIFGPPGSGKDTQADLLDDLYWQFSTGKMIRDLPKEERNVFLSQMKGGALAEDETLFNFVDREYALFSKHRSFEKKRLLLNGLPRKTSQIEETLKRFDIRHLIVLGNLTEKDLLKRLWDRELKNPRGETK